MKAMANLKFFIAQEIYRLAVEKGERYVEKGVAVVPIIKAYMQQHIGHDITDRQARTYAKRLSEETTHIEIYRHFGRGREWRVKLLHTSQKWIYKIRNDGVRAEEERLAKEKKQHKAEYNKFVKTMQELQGEEPGEEPKAKEMDKEEDIILFDPYSPCILPTNLWDPYHRSRPM